MHKLLQGDCIELMKKIPDKSIDLIATDPPYLISATNGGGDN
jgi:DNA modification methylase